MQAVISWPDQTSVPAVPASQFSHTFFSALLLLKASVAEAFALASHTVQALCAPPPPPAAADGTPAPAPAALGQVLLPLLHAPFKAALPDNSSIPAPSIPGLDPAVPLATSVQGATTPGRLEMSVCERRHRSQDRVAGAVAGWHLGATARQL